MMNRSLLLVACLPIALACNTGLCGSSASNVVFAVFSDPHYYDTDLGTEGEAFEDYVAHDRKLIRESEAILRAAVTSLVARTPDFVIVCGDLTKDGEQSSHLEFAAYLGQIESNGIPVYVAPGNHDVLNPHAFAYDTNGVTPVPFVTPEEFAGIYDAYGYGEALDRDTNSLSYVAEPVDGLWLLALDSCNYETNLLAGHAVTAGGFPSNRLDWIMDKLAQAEAGGKTVVAFMHHGMVEHFAGQTVLFPQYVIRDWETVPAGLADAGLKLVFTGHYHCQDAIRRSWVTNGTTTFLFDVETGSLVTYPCPYRIVTVESPEKMTVESAFVTAIDYDTGGVPFPQYAAGFLHEGVFRIAFDLLTLPPEQGGFGLPSNGVTMAVAQIAAESFKAHASGDESPSAPLDRLLVALMGVSNPTVSSLGGMLYNLWHDPLPGDSDPVLYLGPRHAQEMRLGNNPLGFLSIPDVDTFIFRGKAGERVTVRLESVPNESGAGQRATLIVMNVTPGAFLRKLHVLELPGELTFLLPDDGSYRILVAQQKEEAEGTPYVGLYRLELEASSGTAQTLVPNVLAE